jgi:hypothetical protein
MIRILDPTLGTAPTPAALPLAPRPAGLSGATLGLLANGKSNGMALLDRIAAHLREPHGVGELVRVVKSIASAAVSEEDAELVA